MQTPDQIRRKHCRADFTGDVVTAVRAKGAVQDWRIVSEGGRFVAVQEKRAKAEVPPLHNGTAMWSALRVYSGRMLRDRRDAGCSDILLISLVLYWCSDAVI